VLESDERARDEVVAAQMGLLTLVSRLDVLQGVTGGWTILASQLATGQGGHAACKLADRDI
jgi:hypothetical protein